MAEVASGASSRPQVSYLSRVVKVAFASAKAELVPSYIARFDGDTPPAELIVFSEFPPDRGRWIPYRVDRSAFENWDRLRAELRECTVLFAATILQPGAPYPALRWMPLLLAPLRTLIYNANLDHYMLRPRAAPMLLQHGVWRAREWAEFQIRPGGDLYTAWWRLRHPSQLRRPMFRAFGRVIGEALAMVKGSSRAVTVLQDFRPNGISVVVPSRSGLKLLQTLLPILTRELEGIPSELIVSDNGSDDGSLDWLQSTYPQVRVEHSVLPLSFAKAVNRGIRVARYRYVCLLNNDMEPEPQFFAPLWKAFDVVPNLFCSTAQIFFPQGVRREETGKAVFHESGTAFPVHCAEPIDGENLSYVLYGSGGCSLYDAAKLQALGGIDEIYQPAYVEDLDVGYRAWRCGWPTVFVAKSKVVHHHRTTTTRYYTEAELERVLEVNYLRFLVRCVSDPSLFRELWDKALNRLDKRAALEHREAAHLALASAREAWRWRRTEVGIESDEFVAGIGSGDVAVFPGNARRTGPAVLVATAYIPYPLAHGGAVRIYNLMRRAADHFSQVLVTFVDELHTPPKELLDICVEVVQVKRIGSHTRNSGERPDVVEDFDSPAFHAALRLTVLKWKPGVAQLEFTQMALYARDCVPAKTVLVEHDVTIDLYRQLLKTGEDWEVRRQLERWTVFESKAWREVDCVAVMSARDERMIEAADSVQVLQNGVDLERYTPSEVEPDSNRVLFIGSFAHLPNLLALDFLLRDVWPLMPEPRPLLHIIAGSRHEYHFGRNQDRLRFRLDHPGMQIDGFTVDVRPAYSKATAVVAPLLASAGTNIKIMEAMAMGKAIVSTPGGVNGLNLQADDGVLIAAEPAAFAEALARVLRDSELRKAMEARVRAVAEERFSWDTVAGKQRELYERLLKL